MQKRELGAVGTQVWFLEVGALQLCIASPIYFLCFFLIEASWKRFGGKFLSVNESSCKFS